MRFKKSYAVSGLIGVLISGSLWASERIGAHYWPTPNGAFVQGMPLSRFLQPTESGALNSALWGCVRNGGSRFHEGIDLKSIRKDRQGEPTDSIFAFDDGIVRYVNRDSSKSSYGRYVVVEHPQMMPGIVTLYGHLRSVPNSIAPGVAVRGGQSIATMGRSASYNIPRSRAHLHFEVGLWMGKGFQKWYDRQRFDSANDHGDYNGMNIIGMDVWALLQALRREDASNVVEFLAAEPTALSVTVWDPRIPDVLHVNPELMVNYVIPANHAGWRIDFASSGLPLRFEALVAKSGAGSGGVSIEITNEKLARYPSCSGLVGPGRAVVASPRLNGILQRLFVD